MMQTRSSRGWLATAAFALVTAACGDLPTDVDYAPSSSLAMSGNLEVAAPLEGATLSGVSTLKAKLTDRAVTSYTMYWQVAGGGARTRMSVVNGYHVGTADVSTWTWNGEGPYIITFTAESKVKGKTTVVGSGSVQVRVTAPASPVAPVPPTPTTASNPFANATFYVDPYSNAKKTADAWRATRPADASQMDKIASRAQADWFGSWNADIYTAVNARTTAITATGALPVFVAYNIPILNCAPGGAAGPDAYRTWITNFANGIGTRRAVVVLEPDALAALGCLSAADQLVRMELLRYAVQTLKAKGNIAVYVDAGHSRWMSTATMITRLKSAGGDLADGFSLNVSNYVANPEVRAYGEVISAGLGGKHFIIDTSRNGQGTNGEWCNATGRGLGSPATANTGAALVDAFFWIKRPGESDGTCSGGPTAGKWWSESATLDQAHALGLATRSTSLLAMN